MIPLRELAGVSAELFSILGLDKIDKAENLPKVYVNKSEIKYEQSKEKTNEAPFEHLIILCSCA
jgi:hypothetical protein